MLNTWFWGGRANPIDKIFKIGVVIRNRMKSAHFSATGHVHFPKGGLSSRLVFRPAFRPTSCRRRVIRGPLIIGSKVIWQNGQDLWNFPKSRLSFGQDCASEENLSFGYSGQELVSKINPFARYRQGSGGVAVGLGCLCWCWSLD